MANIRAQLSVALHADMSGKIVMYLFPQIVGHGLAGLDPRVAEEAAEEVAAVADH